jgi:hypothetical protein
MAITEHANGFIQVGQEYVQGMRSHYRVSSDRANASRPSCTCRNGHAPAWCEHKTLAAEFVRKSIA